MALIKKHFRCNVPIEYPTDPAVIRRVLAGEKVPYAERKMKRAEAGEIVMDLPQHSVIWMVRKGWIDPVEEEPAANFAGLAGVDEREEVSA